MNQAKSNQAQAQTSVDKQAQVVANDQSEVDKTNATDLSNKLNQANSAVTNDNQAISNAQKALDQAKANDAQNAKQVADKQNELTDAQKALDNAVKANQSSQADLTSAKNNQASVKADLDAKQKEVNNIKSQMGNVNTIIVPKGYTVDKVKQAYADANKGNTSFAENFYNTVGKNGMTINEYKANAKDIAETVDLKNITPEQQLEINKFAVGLINQVREQLGLQKIILNQDGMNIAKEVVAGYAEQGEILKFVHDVHNVLDPVAKDHELYGLAENRSWNYYGKTSSWRNVKGNDSYYTDYDNDNYVNMAVVKSDIYDDILNMLFEDNFDTNSAYGHANNFLENSYDTGDKDSNGNKVVVPLKNLYMGIGIANDDNGQKTLSSFYEIIPVYDSITYQTKDDVTYDSFTIYPGMNQNSSTFAYDSSINTDTPNYAQQLKQATDELSAKQTALDEAKQATTQAQAKADTTANALAAAQNKVNALTSELNQLKAYKAQTPQAQSTLDNANAKLAQDTKTRDDLQAQLNNLNDAIKAKVQTLANAKADLATKQTALDEAKQVTAQAQAKTDTTANALAAAQNKVNALTSELNQLKAYKAQTPQAQSTLDNANAKLAQDTKTRDDLQAQLNNLNDAIKAKVQTLANAKADLATKQTALDEAKQVTAQAQAKADKANQDLANAQSALAKLQANLLNLQAYKPQQVQAQNALTKANQKLADDNKKSSDLVVALQNLAETRSQRQATLDQTKADLATKQKALDEAKAVATSAQAKLDSDKQTLAKLQANLTSAQTNLDNAKKALADLENLPERLAQAKADVQKAQADLTSAQAKLDEAKKALAESQANADVANETLDQANAEKAKAQTAYDKTMKAYNDYLKAQQAVKDAEEKAKVQAQAKAEHTYFAQTANGKVIDEKGHIMVGYSVKGNQVFDAQGKLVGTLAQTSTTRRMANTVKQENAKALPQTGDKQNNNTTVGAILVGLGSLLGLGALGKRKED